MENIKDKIENYKKFRKIQKSLKKYSVSPTEFDVLISLYSYPEWVSCSLVKQESGVSPSVFSDQGITPLVMKDYIKTKKEFDQRAKSMKMTSQGRDLVEKILSEVNLR